MASDRTTIPDSEPLWYKDAVIYEVHVRAFYDSDEDGMGDFRGLTKKLDYLQDLGITAIWLLPFFPSPWRDDGYDISDYNDVHTAYGSLRDFQNFLKQAHRRGIRVLTEVVLNHTSDQHPWFQRSRHAAPGTRWRDFYVWSDTAEKYQDARIIFKDFETSNWTWDPVAKAYYWHRFYSHQPDLNFDSPYVREAILDIIDFWFDLGVDGFRLDAVPYLYEREGTNCENLTETHAFLKELRAHIDSKYKDRILLAEANQWPEDAVAYFADGSECHMAFHFPLMPRLFMAIRSEDRFPVMEILQETPAIPSNCQWALFLRNHDELTLEMVTDEERDYMYRVYAHDRRMRINLGIRRRLAPLLENDRRKIELMNALLFSLPGTPVIYYGDEIGMGDNIYLGDRNGVRTPMQWSADRNAGFSRANPQKLYMPITIDPAYHYEAINVEGQQNNPHSLLWWTKHLIEQRKQFKALGRGTLEFLRPSNRKVLAFYRRLQDEIVLVVANLSRFPQYVELDLAEVRGMTPVEVFGRAEFPVVNDQPYSITLGSLGFYWFAFQAKQVHPETIQTPATPEGLPLIVVEAGSSVFQGRSLAVLLRRLPAYLNTRRWFLGKGRPIRTIDVMDAIPIPDSSAQLLLGEVEYIDGDPEIYVLPGSVATGEAAEQVKSKLSDVSVAQLHAEDGTRGVLYSAIFDPAFGNAMFSAILRRRRYRGRAGELVGSHTRAFRAAWGGSHPDLGPAVLKAEQSNTSIAFGTKFILKIYRRVEPGIHPEVEIGTFLTERNFPHSAPLTGVIEYRTNIGEPMVIASLHAFVENQGDAWTYTLDALSQFFEASLARKESDFAGPDGTHHPLDMRKLEIPAHAHESIGSYLDSAALLGRRVADLHRALGSDSINPAFAPEPFTDHYRHAIFHGLMGQSAEAFQLLRQRMKSLPASLQSDAQKVLDRREDIRACARLISERRIYSVRTRIHDDLGLNRVLHTGKDFVFIGFDGPSERTLSGRRIKRSPLRDVATMLLSFQYASQAVFLDQLPGVTRRPETAAALEFWARYWSDWVSAIFLKGYLDTMGDSPLVPQNEADLRLLLDHCVLEQTLEQASDELRRGADWARVPLGMLLRMLEARRSQLVS
ncbi:MAG TPA: maltose alpha-D-glucosyltransferase [Bryobacteraceae bacterium]|nr:maltose alpha-D-glucosyltransferase [Bryobacteraceae bacterium]